MGIVPESVAEDAKAEMRRLAAERYAPTPRPTGRPTKFSQVMADEICRRMADGESLRSICRDDDMPAKSTVLKWAANLDKDPKLDGFSDQYGKAMTLSGDADHDDVGDIARQVARGELDPSAGNVAMNGLKWTAGRKNAKKYGDKAEISGTLSITLEQLILGSMSGGEK